MSSATVSAPRPPPCRIGPPCTILLVDDDDNSRFLMNHQVTRILGSRGVVHTVDDGEAAISYFCGDGPFADRDKFPFPTMLITDLNMPNGDGFALLEFLRSNPGWSIIPKIVYSCSCDADDIRTAYFLGASAFHQKPAGVDSLRASITLILDYWLGCEVPHIDADGRLLPTNHRGKLGERFALPEPSSRMARRRPAIPAASR